MLKGGLSKMPIEVKHVIEKHAIKEGIENRKQEKDQRSKIMAHL
jgi:hypothetical protein